MIPLRSDAHWIDDKPDPIHQIEYHVSRAVDLGVGRQEILETTALAVALNGAVADWPARYVFKVLDDIP